MKITSEKHNHKLTNLLKVFIFSVLMLLPFINVAVRCGYVMLNKNANESYSGTSQTQINYKYESNEVNSGEDLLPGNIYKLNNYNISDYDMQEYIEFTFIILNDDFSLNGLLSDKNYEDDNYIYKNTEYTLHIEHYNGNNNCFIAFSNLNYLQYVFTSFTSDEDNLIIKLQYINEINDILNENLIENLFEYTDYNEIASISIVEDTLDNVFEYSLNKLEEEQYLTWTQNTAVYTGVNGMTTGLGITQTVIPMLIVYWFILTIIYIIIDIILALFTKLTHMIGNKTT